MSEPIEKEVEERENDEVEDTIAESLSNEDLMQQYEIYRDLVELQLDDQHKKMLGHLLEMERELALREEQPY